jgi:2-keto-4-pentenoate hydratase
MTSIQEIAIRQLSDYDASKPGSIFARPDFRLTVDQAYQVQNAVAGLRQARGELVAGYKVGCVSDTMQRQLGLDRPVFGRVWETELYHDAAAIDSKGFDGLAIEGELALRLADDVPSAEWLKRNPDVLSEAFVVIELHNYVFRSDQEQAAAELIANNAIHAGVVIPEHGTPWTSSVSLGDVMIRVSKNGQLLGKESLESLPGGPLESAVRLAEHLSRWEMKAKRGQFVLTGSPLPLWRVEPGDHVGVACTVPPQHVNAVFK